MCWCLSAGITPICISIHSSRHSSTSVATQGTVAAAYNTLCVCAHTSTKHTCAHTDTHTHIIIYLHENYSKMYSFTLNNKKYYNCCF